MSRGADFADAVSLLLRPRVLLLFFAVPLNLVPLPTPSFLPAETHLRRAPCVSFAVPLHAIFYTSTPPLFFTYLLSPRARDRQLKHAPARSLPGINFQRYFETIPKFSTNPKYIHIYIYVNRFFGRNREMKFHLSF